MNLADVTFSNHFLAQAKDKGFTAEQIREAIERPYMITPVMRYPGQMRHCGAGVAVVMRENVAVTIYLDGVVTPMRADQVHDVAALGSKRLNRNDLPAA